MWAKRINIGGGKTVKTLPALNLFECTGFAGMNKYLQSQLRSWTLEVQGRCILSERHYSGTGHGARHITFPQTMTPLSRGRPSSE